MNIFVIDMYGVMKYSLLVPNLVAFYAKLNEMYKHNEFHFALEVSSSTFPPIFLVKKCQFLFASLGDNELSK